MTVNVTVTERAARRIGEILGQEFRRHDAARQCRRRWLLRFPV